ncbi:29185_t:CDS:2 [Gigaspora margarita]|uniref:29185_t:CDS:1 n=1 Tax=Gigaspora margarita TaxID=4874 RepID=A0ABN7ULX7_GIGMA|nr:29185_t:CDS:2 [Gigaspora margarita]
MTNYDSINNIADSQYVKETSNYIKLLNELRRVGAHFAVNLPTIVFYGNQFAGKISLRKEYDENEKRLSNLVETKIKSKNWDFKVEVDSQLHDNQAIVTLSKEAHPLDVRTLELKLINLNSGIMSTKVQREKSITIEEARLAENPWNDYLRERIKNKLFELLIKSIKRGLPNIRKDFFLIGCNVNGYNKKISDATFDILEDFIEDLNEIVNNAHESLLLSSIPHSVAQTMNDSRNLGKIEKNLPLIV